MNIPELGELSFSDDCREQQRTKKASRTIDPNPYTKAYVQLKYGIFFLFSEKVFFVIKSGWLLHFGVFVLVFPLSFYY